jgi:anthranilate phosphoribosyltransferase
MIAEYIRKIIMGENLSQAEMQKTMEKIIDGRVTASQVGSFVTALRMKGESADEITGAAKALRSRVPKLQYRTSPESSSLPLLNLDRDDINVEEETIEETSAMGENGTSTFNVSTATVFVAAGGGVKIARYGNRAASAYFGAADVLEHLGVNLDISASDAERCIEEIGISFLFAPLFHGPMRYVASLREEMGIRTIFNLIGPLANPAGASAFMLGVYNPAMTEKMVQVLARLGADEAFVVCGEGTFDEISVCGPTRISRLIKGKAETYMIEPEEYGFKRAAREDIRGGNAQKNARIIRDILDGEPGPKRDTVVLNAGAAFVAAGLDNDLKEGIERAKEVIDSGKAKEKLDALIRFTGQCMPFMRKELL